MEIARKYLQERYYKYDQIIFKACESLTTPEFPVYRFSGLIIEKSRAFLDRLSRDKSAVTFKFIIDISSLDGRILNHTIN